MPEPSTPQANVLQRFVLALRDQVIGPLMTDTDYVGEVFAAFGLSTKGATLLVDGDRLKSIDDYINANADTAGIEAFLTAADDVGALFNAFRSFVEGSLAAATPSKPRTMPGGSPTCTFWAGRPFWG